MSIRILKESSQIIVVDIQQKLAPHLADAQAMIEASTMILQGAQLFDIPITIAEQYPQGLGESVAQILPFKKQNVFSKTSFSCFGDDALSTALLKKKSEGRNTLIVVGCEAHVCVLQTVIDALEHHFRVAVISDAVASRKLADKELAEKRLSLAGAEYLSSEMLLFEWTQSKQALQFKQISALVK